MLMILLLTQGGGDGGWGGRDKTSTSCLSRNNMWLFT